MVQFDEEEQTEDPRATCGHVNMRRSNLPTTVCVKRQGDLYEYVPMDRGSKPIKLLFLVRLGKCRENSLTDDAVLPVKLQKECQQELRKLLEDSRAGKRK